MSVAGKLFFYRKKSHQKKVFAISSEHVSNTLWLHPFPMPTREAKCPVARIHGPRCWAARWRCRMVARPSGMHLSWGGLCSSLAHTAKVSGSQVSLLALLPQCQHGIGQIWWIEIEDCRMSGWYFRISGCKVRTVGYIHLHFFFEFIDTHV